MTPVDRQAFIQRCLDTRDPPDGSFSPFSAGVRDARRMTGRIEATGKPSEEFRPESWLGALGYMAVLDHVGGTLRPARVPRLEGTGIRLALRYFAPSLSPEEIDAIYALRCSFAHDFGLVNMPPDASRRARKSLTHWFALSSAPSRPLVALPPRPWDRKFRSDPARNEECWTWVSVPKFGDLVEGIIDDLQVRAQNRRLVLLMRLEKYTAMYGIQVHPD